LAQIKRFCGEKKLFNIDLKYFIEQMLIDKDRVMSIEERVNLFNFLIILNEFDKEFIDCPI